MVHPGGSRVQSKALLPATVKWRTYTILSGRLDPEKMPAGLFICADAPGKRLSARQNLRRRLDRRNKPQSQLADLIFDVEVKKVVVAAQHWTSNIAIMG